MAAGFFETPVSGEVGLSASGVCKAFGRVPAVFPVSLSLGSGAGLALLGPNGSGKTTLLRLLAGVSRPAAGHVSFSGLSPESDPSGYHEAVGFLGHDSYLYDDLTGYENLEFQLTLRRQKLPGIDIWEALDLVELTSVARDRVRTYSTGMKRRLGLARLLLSQPAVLLLDEPHAGLDAAGQSLVDTIVSSARGSGRIVVMASHDHERSAALCDQVMVLDRGRVIFQGEAASWRDGRPLWLMGQARS